MPEAEMPIPRAAGKRATPMPERRAGRVVVPKEAKTKSKRITRAQVSVDAKLIPIPKDEVDNDKYFENHSTFAWKIPPKHSFFVKGGNLKRVQQAIYQRHSERRGQGFFVAREATGGVRVWRIR